MKAFCAVVRNYEWVRLGVGTLGNVTFLTGSFLFLHEVKPLSSYLFIAGSAGMLVGTLGSTIVRLERSWAGSGARGAPAT
jgi:YrhK-like protein